jgi:hypothetical protein
VDMVGRDVEMAVEVAEVVGRRVRRGWVVGR